MINLPNNCQCSQPAVNPKNWLTCGVAGLKKNWFIKYYFRDPNFPEFKNGKPVVLKRMNVFKTLAQRREATQMILDNELNKLHNLAYNPITLRIIEPEIVEQGLTASTSFITAFVAAKKNNYKKNEVADSTLNQSNAILRNIEWATKALGYEHIPVAEIKPKHIKALINQIGLKENIKWTNINYNTHLSYTKAICNELVNMDILEFSPCQKIGYKSIVKKLRVILTPNERLKVSNYLKTKNYNFYRFCNIFFHSGGRTTELLLIKKKDVLIDQQKYKATIKKGKNPKEILRTIKDIVLPYWEELLAEAGPDDYVFSRNFSPGKEKMQDRKPSIFWKVYVKQDLGIDVDFYSLKHANLDETAVILDDNAASKMAGHATLKMTRDNYLVGHKERQHLLIKALDNEF